MTPLTDGAVDGRRARASSRLIIALVREEGILEPLMKVLRKTVVS